MYLNLDRGLIKNKKLIPWLTGIGILLSAGVILGLNGYFGGGGSIPEDTFTRGLVGYWSFDEGSGATSTDLSGNGNDGTLTNSPQWTTGKSGGGLQFDGVNDYVDCGNPTSLNIAGVITVEAWVYPKAANSVIYEDSTAAHNPTLILIYQADGKFEFLRYSAGWRATTDPSVKPLNAWYHIVGTYDGSYQRLYVNGQEVALLLFSGDLDDTAGRNVIGIDSRLDPTYGIMNGLIDEVRIYNRALSAEEVRYHYNRGGPVGHWKFDEGSGTAIRGQTSTEGGLTSDGSIKSSSLKFDGVDDYVLVPASPSIAIKGNPISIELWLNMAGSGNSWQKLLTKWESLNLNGWNLNTNLDGRIFFDFFTDVNNRVGRSYNGLAQYFGQWTHIVATYDGSGTEAGIKIFINGLQVDNLSDTAGNYTGFDDSAYDLFIGRRHDAADRFRGLIDEVRIYNRALSASESKNRYNQTKHLFGK